MSNKEKDASIKVIDRNYVESQYSYLSSVPATYDGPVRLLDWKHSGKVGMTVDLVLALPGPLGSHAFRGMNQGRTEGQRLFSIISFPRQHDGTNMPVVYFGETLLVVWTENGRVGMMVRLMLDDGPDGVRGRHPFFGLSMGKLTGESLNLVSWAIDDDEQAMPASRLRKRTPFHTLTEVQQSNILCRDIRFRQFLRANLHLLVEDRIERDGLLSLEDTPESFAAAAVRSALKVSSRSIMNRDGEAAINAVARWRSLVGRYEEWRYGIIRR